MKHLFLDLEDTLITPVYQGWMSAELKEDNIALIRKLCSWADDVHVFSFAMHNEKTKLAFQCTIQQWLEGLIGRKFNWNPTTDEMETDCCEHMGIMRGIGRFDFSDMTDFYGKEYAFELYIKRRIFFKEIKPGDHCMLLDDTIMNPSDKIIWPLRGQEKGVTILTRNPYQTNLWSHMPYETI